MGSSTPPVRGAGGERPEGPWSRGARRRVRSDRQPGAGLPGDRIVVRARRDGVRAVLIAAEVSARRPHAGMGLVGPIQNLMTWPAVRARGWGLLLPVSPSRGPADDSHARGGGRPTPANTPGTCADDFARGEGAGSAWTAARPVPDDSHAREEALADQRGARGRWTMIRMRGEGPWRGRRRRGSRAHAPGRAPREADEPLPRGPSAVPGPPVRCIARPTRASCRPPVGVVVPTLGQGLPAGRSVVGTCRPVSRRSGPPRARPAPPAPPAPARRASRPAGRPPR